jgi:hypothetical protein
MKNSVIILGALLTGSVFFTSCTKDLKNDVKNLKQEVADLQSAIGSDEPITATTTFTDNNNATRTVSDTYKFKANSYRTQYMEKNSDGTYYVYIERFSDVNWNEGAWVDFDYNPTTKEVTNKEGGQYWEDSSPYGGNATYYDGATGCTTNITVDKFDATTGEISLKFDASATSDYDGNSPNPGKPMHTTFSFTGKVKLFATN